MSQPMTACERAQRVLTEIGGVGAQFGVDSKSKAFLRDLVANGKKHLSEKQRKWLESLEHKVFVVGVAN